MLVKILAVDLEEPPESCGAVARRCDVAQKVHRGETLSTHYYPPCVNKENGSTPKSDRDDPDDLEEPPEWCGAVAHEREGLVDDAVDGLEMLDDALFVERDEERRLPTHTPTPRISVPASRARDPVRKIRVDAFLPPVDDLGFNQHLVG